VGPAVDENRDGVLGELVAAIGESLRAEQGAELADGEDLAVGGPRFRCPAVASWVGSLGSPARAGGLARIGTRRCGVAQARASVRPCVVGPCVGVPARVGAQPRVGSGSGMRAQPCADARARGRRFSSLCWKPGLTGLGSGLRRHGPVHLRRRPKAANRICPASPLTTPSAPRSTSDADRDRRPLSSLCNYAIAYRV
jgi:hypothetical protein